MSKPVAGVVCLSSSAFSPHFVVGTYYHTGSAAYPVLNDRECAEPLKDACDKRPDFKTAYLEGKGSLAILPPVPNHIANLTLPLFEGPISCGNNGW